MTTDIEQFVSLRKQFVEEHKGIDAQIDALQVQLQALKDRKKELSKVLLSSSALPEPTTPKARPKKTSAPKRAGRPKPDPNVAKLIDMLKVEPGMDRDTIRSKFPRLDNHQLTLLFSKCKKRGIITNVGTKRQPLWEVVKEG